MATKQPEMTTKTNPISTEKLSNEDIGLIFAIIMVIIIIIIVLVPIFVTKTKKTKNLPYQAFQDEEDLNFPRITSNPEYFQLNSEVEPRTLIMAPKYIVNDQESAVLL